MSGRSRKSESRSQNRSRTFWILTPGFWIRKGVFLLFLAGLTPAHAYFQPPTGSVRAMGMGGAYLAVAEGADAPLWNPAGIAQSPKRQMTLSYENRFAGLDVHLYDDTPDGIGTHTVGFSTPIPADFGHVGVGWYRQNAALLDEDLLTLTYARRVVPNVYAGLNWRWFGLSLRGNEYGVLDPDLPNGSESRWDSSVDVGILSNVGKSIWLGASAENLRTPTVGFAEGERLRRRFGVGLARRTERFTQSLEMSWRGFADKKDVTETEFRAGVEFRPVPNLLTLRAGYDLHAVSGGMSVERRMRPGWTTQVHYAARFALDGPQETLGTHQFGLGVAF